MTLDSRNAFTVTVALQSVLWKYSVVIRRVNIGDPAYRIVYISGLL